MRMTCGLTEYKVGGMCKRTVRNIEVRLSDIRPKRGPFGVAMTWVNKEPGRWTCKQKEPAIIKALAKTFDLDDEIAFEVYEKMGDAFSNFKDIVETVEV